jgi:hypothetical protein
MQAIINNLTEYWAQYRIMDKELRDRDTRTEDLRKSIQANIEVENQEESKKGLRDISILIRENDIMQREATALLIKVTEMYLLAVSANLSTGLKEEDEEKIKSAAINMQTVYYVDMVKKAVMYRDESILTAMKQKIDEALEDERRVKISLESPLFKK